MCPDCCPQPLTPEAATERIRKIAKGGYTFSWTDDVKEKLRAGGLVVGDINYICKNGTVVAVADATNHPGHYKYRVASRSPSSSKKIIVIEISFSSSNEIKVFDVII